MRASRSPTVWSNSWAREVCKLRRQVISGKEDVSLGEAKSALVHCGAVFSKHAVKVKTSLQFIKDYANGTYIYSDQWHVSKYTTETGAPVLKQNNICRPYSINTAIMFCDQKHTIAQWWMFIKASLGQKLWHIYCCTCTQIHDCESQFHINNFILRFWFWSGFSSGICSLQPNIFTVVYKSMTVNRSSTYQQPHSKVLILKWLLFRHLLPTAKHSMTVTWQACSEYHHMCTEQLMLSLTPIMSLLLFKTTGVLWRLKNLATQVMY